MAEKIDYGSRKFGDFRSIGNSPDDFINRPVREKVFLAARSHLCPIPEVVVKNYGLEKATSRYSECNFTMRELILHSAKELNPRLYRNLKKTVNRVPGELPDQNLNSKYLPKEFQEKMRLASTVYGYALPRILIVQFGENRGEDSLRTQERILKGLEVLDEVVTSSTDPLAFTVNLAEKVSHEDADPRRVIYHLLSLGILEEEGCKTMFKRTLSLVEYSAPKLWSIYKNLLKEKGEAGLHEMGIVAPSDLK